MYNFKDAYSEVYTILQYLEENDKSKIPNDVLQAIDENRNKDYIFKYDEYTDLMNQDLMPETKAILFNLFRDYLADSRQKEIIIKMQRDEKRRNEVKKREEFLKSGQSFEFKKK